MPQRSLPLHGYHKKRAGKIFILITALILFLLLSSCSNGDESVYFDMLTHGDKPRDMQERHRIFHYDGKSGYSVVYTFEDTKPLTAIEDHYLYYTPYKGKEGQPTALHRVDLITGEDIV